MSTDAPERDSLLPSAMTWLLRRLAERGREGVERVTHESRRRLELRQLRRERDEFWIRLGKTAYHLVEGGEIEHPALRKAMARIDDLEARIRAHEHEGEDAGPSRDDPA
jgi:hypothetical protein